MARTRRDRHCGRAPRAGTRSAQPLHPQSRRRYLRHYGRGEEGLRNSTRRSRLAPTISLACISGAASTPGLAGMTRRWVFSRGESSYQVERRLHQLLRLGAGPGRAHRGGPDAGCRTGISRADRVRPAPASRRLLPRLGTWTARSTCSNVGVRDRNGWIGFPRMPMFENFREDPRYAEHLRRIGHPDAEWASATV